MLELYVVPLADANWHSRAVLCKALQSRRISRLFTRHS